MIIFWRYSFLWNVCCFWCQLMWYLLICAYVPWSFPLFTYKFEELVWQAGMSYCQSVSWMRRVWFHVLCVWWNVCQLELFEGMWASWAWRRMKLGKPTEWKKGSSLQSLWFMALPLRKALLSTTAFSCAGSESVISRIPAASHFQDSHALMSILFSFLPVILLMNWGRGSI